jgi:putative ABC transport system ATP-binding protein
MAGVVRSSPILVGRALTKSWAVPGGRLDVLKGVDITVEPGQTVAIIGPSGSGKSTLLGILGALDRPTSGELMIGNTDTARLSDHELAKWRGKSLGIVFQQFHLMPSLTALENIALPLEIAGDRDARRKASDAIGEVGLFERKNHLPRELSGGECQRIALARALVTNPSLLLADEPSGSLDPKTGEQVANLLFDLVRRHGMAVILVTHNMELANRCERKLKMADGLLTAL